jgi:hypothetical protein
VLYVPAGATFGVGSKKCAASAFFLLTSAFFINIDKNFSKYGALATSFLEPGEADRRFISFFDGR